MTDNLDTSTLLNLPHVDPIQFKKNYLDQVVVDLRFPILLEIPETNPVEIQKKLRSKFPNYRLVNNTELLPGAGTRNRVVHEFVGKTGKELVTLSEGNLSMSTNSYSNYADFKDKFEFVFDIISPHLETDFFTRVGLRYINRISTPNIRKELPDWMNKDLIMHVANGALGSVTGLKMEVHGKIDNDGSVYAFRSGLIDQLNQNTNSNQKNVDFVLDFDCGKNDVEASDVFPLLDFYNKTNYNFFWWSLGEKARSDLKGD